MTSTRPIIIAILVGAVIIGACLIAGLLVGLRDDCDDNGNDKTNTKSGADASQVYQSASGSYHYAAVATDAEVCSDIGRDIMAVKGGNAMDAAVAAAFCVGLLNSHSTGIGGGGFFTIYHKETGTWHSVDSRETAPAAATEKMFYAQKDHKYSTYGGKAIAVPGEVMGLYEVHTKFGRTPWKTVLKPIIDMCTRGIPLREATRIALVARVEGLSNKTGFEAYLDGNNKAKPTGSLINRTKLCKTLQTVSDDPMAFYTGSLAQDIVDDIQERDGIITLDDLKNFKVEWSEPTKSSLPGNLKLFSMPPPGSGPILSFILNILSGLSHILLQGMSLGNEGRCGPLSQGLLDNGGMHLYLLDCTGYHMTPDSVATDDAKILTYHRIVEAMKFGFAKRSLLGDARFVKLTELIKNLTSSSYGEATRLKITDSATHDTDFYEPDFSSKEDDGTTHLSVIDAEGNAVSMTGTINTYFGSKVIGSRTGIIFNNEMDDFSTPNLTNIFNLPPSEANFIRPGKRPMSSMCPAIVWDEASKNVTLIVGASGGTRITTAVAMVIMNVLWFDMPLAKAIDEQRFHHQLLPKEIFYLKAVPPKIKAGLEAKGHKFKQGSMSVVQGVHVVKYKDIEAVSDYRKGGRPAGY